MQDHRLKLPFLMSNLLSVNPAKLFVFSGSVPLHYAHFLTPGKFVFPSYGNLTFTPLTGSRIYSLEFRLGFCFGYLYYRFWVACHLPIFYSLQYNLGLRTYTNRWSSIGRRWILHPDAKILTGLFTLPTYSLIYRILHLNGPRHRAVENTTTTKPAFIGIQHNRWFTFLWVGYHHIRPAHLYTLFAACAELSINKNYLARCHRVGYRIRFTICFVFHNHLYPFQCDQL